MRACLTVTVGTRRRRFHESPLAAEWGIGETRRERGGRVAVLRVLAWLIAFGRFAGTALAQTTFEFAEVPEALVVQLSRDVGIRDADQTPLLQKRAPTNG